MVRLLTAATHVLCGDGAYIAGLKIFGVPWLSGWDYSLIPDDIDILISHIPPKGLHDQISPEKGSKHVGSRDILLNLPRINPLIHLYGHVHEDRGVTVLPSWRALLPLHHSRISSGSFVGVDTEDRFAAHTVDIPGSRGPTIRCSIPQPVPDYVCSTRWLHKQHQGARHEFHGDASALMRGRQTNSREALVFTRNVGVLSLNGSNCDEHSTRLVHDPHFLEIRKQLAGAPYGLEARLVR
jgi:hypothetical protein